jgi:hypothetical protein
MIKQNADLDIKLNRLSILHEYINLFNLFILMPLNLKN